MDGVFWGFQFFDWMSLKTLKVEARPLFDCPVLSWISLITGATWFNCFSSAWLLRAYRGLKIFRQNSPMAFKGEFFSHANDLSGNENKQKAFSLEQALRSFKKTVTDHRVRFLFVFFSKKEKFTTEQSTCT